MHPGKRYTPESREHSPLYCYRHEREDAGGDRTGGDELRELAVGRAEWPVAIQHVDEVKHGVENGDERIGDRQVDEEVVGHRAHSSMS